MSLNDTCQCPKCGRLHRDLNFGKPPEAIQQQADLHADLMKHYGVSTMSDLVAAQDHHIARLQEKLPKPAGPFFPPNVRQG